MSAKRINVGYLSSLQSIGTVKTISYNESSSKETRVRAIDADIDICLTCKKKTCSGKCKRVRFKKKEEA